MSENFNLQASFKTRSGTLINLRAESEEELGNYLDALGRLIPQIDSIESLIGAMETVYAVMAPDRGAGGGNRSYGGGRPQASAAPADAPAGGGHTCAHGDMTYRTGEGKNGRKWEAYFCPAPKGDPTQCQPQWV
jgi:hypothetical protein